MSCPLLPWQSLKLQVNWGRQEKRLALPWSKFYYICCSQCEFSLAAAASAAALQFALPFHSQFIVVCIAFASLMLPFQADFEIQSPNCFLICHSMADWLPIRNRSYCSSFCLASLPDFGTHPPLLLWDHFARHLLFIANTLPFFSWTQLDSKSPNDNHRCLGP